MSELDLTFSVDEDQMGKIVTHELHSGGRARPVTNDNKYGLIYGFFLSHQFKIGSELIKFEHDNFFLLFCFSG